MDRNLANPTGDRVSKQDRAARSKYLITAVSMIGAVAASIVVQKLVKSHVSEAVRQGVGMYVMWVGLYPAMKAWSPKPEGTLSSRKRRLTFIGWMIIGLLPGVMVAIMYSYFP